MQLCQQVLWLAPNAYSLLHTCAWFDDFVSICGVLRWSLWNLVSSLLEHALTKKEHRTES